MRKLLTSSALCALLAIAGSAFAQDPTANGGVMNNGGLSNNSTMNQPGGVMNKSDMLKTRWAFYNADQREVNRFKAKGFSEADFKAIANIALQTGLDTDYIGRQVQEVGRPLSFVAAMYSVSTTSLDDDIPGFNAAPGSITPTGMMVPTTTSTSMTGSTSTTGSSSTAPSSSSPGTRTPTTPTSPATPTTPSTPSTPAEPSTPSTPTEPSSPTTPPSTP